MSPAHVHTQACKQAHTHTHASTEKHTPCTSTRRFIVFPVSHCCPTILQSSHSRKLKERVAVPQAPLLFDLCEPLSLMKISCGAPDNVGPLIEERLVHHTTASVFPTSERCNRPAGVGGGCRGEAGGSGQVPPMEVTNKNSGGLRSSAFGDHQTIAYSEMLIFI